jgi:hypothetical protein
MTYRDSDKDRADLAAKEREAAAWLAALEAARTERAPVPSRSGLLWVVMMTGPGSGAVAAAVLATLCGIEDRSAFVLVGGFVGFVAAIVVASRIEARRRKV